MSRQVTIPSKNGRPATSCRSLCSDFFIVCQPSIDLHLADQDVSITNTAREHCMGLVVTLQHKGALGQKGVREGDAPVSITVKRFNNKAQGRREGGAPWVQREEVRGTPTGSDNMDGHFLRIMSDMSSVHPVRRMFNPVGVGGNAFVANPGCAACASTLGFVVERLRRKQKFGLTIATACVVATAINRALEIRTPAMS